MCGIAGFVGSPNSTILKAMVTSLTHRGPDDAGYYEGGGVSLGMRRLAIIDVETGQQPAFSADGSIVVVFNGEIYNAPALRRELEQKGYTFRSDHSDTEVIAPLYQEHGVDFVHRLNGMFAIAIWDTKRKQLHLYRDQAGIKPLYFAKTSEGLVFGSEIKALLAHPAVSRAPDFVAIHHYFSFKNVPAPLSAFQQVKQLRAGEMLTLQDGKIEVKRWWRIAFRDAVKITEQEAVAEVRRLLEDSVALQMQSDVPFGAYLSGGVDSSSVVAIMARLTGRPIKTFTMVYDEGFANKDADRTHALSVSRMYNTEHHEFLARYNHVPESIEAVTRAFDEPFSGVISTFFITQLIAEHVKVCLSGDGADELFGSYIGPRSAGPLALRQKLRSGALTMTDEVRAGLGEFANKLDQLDRILDQGGEAAQRMTQYIATDAQKRALYSPFMLEKIGSATTEALITDVLSAAGTDDPVNRALFLDFETLLPDQVLPFVDRLSMAHSVEVRPPFLDHRLIELAATLPGSMKIRNGRVKSVLKDAVRGLLPDAILDRPKEGFIMPINAWVLENLRTTVEERLAPDRLSRHGLLDAAAIRRLLDAHYARTENNGNRIWNLFMFQVWWDLYQEA